MFYTAILLTIQDVMHHVGSEDTHKHLSLVASDSLLIFKF